MLTRLARLGLFSVLAAGASTSAALAQLPGPGMSWQGSSGIAVRSFLPECRAVPVAAARGETVVVTVWGDLRSPYALVVSPVTATCQQIPGIRGGLILGPPIATLATGALTQVSPCLSCPEAFDDLTFVVPGGVPSGTRVTFQALAFGARSPGFTFAVTATVP